MIHTEFKTCLRFTLAIGKVPHKLTWSMLADTMELHAPSSAPSATPSATPSTATPNALDAVAVATATPAGTTATAETQPPLRRKGGRAKDAIWDETTILADKSVVCNHCHAVIHRYGCSKVERVRAHFELRCLVYRGVDGSDSSNLTRPAASKKHKTERDGDSSNSSSVSASSSLLRPTPASTTAATAAANKSTAAVRAARRASHLAKVTAFKRSIAQWIYATAQPFDTVEHDLFVRALRLLRADMPLPNPVELAGALLELEATGSSANVRAQLAGKACCLAVEHWRDATGAHHVNYAAVSPAASYLLASSTVSSAAATLELSVEMFERVLAPCDRSAFRAIATPECAMLTPATRARVQSMAPQCTFFYGCVYHALELLVADLAAVLPWLEPTLTDVRELMQTIAAEPTLQRQFPDLARLARASVGNSNPHSRRRVDVHATVAWLSAIVASESALDTAVARRDFVDAESLAARQTRQRVQDFVLSETFRDDLVRATRVLVPVQQQLERFESPATLAHAYRCFLDLQEAYSAMDCVSRKEKALLASCITERLAAIYSDAHGVAYVLDPLFLGADMDAATRQATERFIASYCRDMALEPVQDELAAYAARVCELQMSDAAYWATLERDDVRTFDFWSTRRECPLLLQQLAYAVFSLPPTTTAPPRAFRATCEQLHARFRETLSDQKLEQLTLVHCNAAASGRPAELASLAPEPPMLPPTAATSSDAAASEQRHTGSSEM